MFEELQKRAIEKKHIVYSNKRSTDEEQKLAEYCYNVYSNEDNVKALSKRDIFATFVLLGVYDDQTYENNNYRYNTLMSEVNKKYTLVQPRKSLNRENQ